MLSQFCSPSCGARKNFHSSSVFSTAAPNSARLIRHRRRFAEFAQSRRATNCATPRCAVIENWKRENVKKIANCKFSAVLLYTIPTARVNTKIKNLCFFEKIFDLPVYKMCEMCYHIINSTISIAVSA